MTATVLRTLRCFSTIAILEPAPTVSYSLENLTLIRGETMDSLGAATG